jgi:hypothetical protein
MGSDFLFGMPSALSGAARTLDIMGEFDHYNDSPSENSADAKALLCDWRVVGDAIRDAMKAFTVGPQESVESDESELTAAK